MHYQTFYTHTEWGLLSKTACHLVFEPAALLLYHPAAYFTSLSQYQDSGIIQIMWKSSLNISGVWHAGQALHL